MNTAPHIIDDLRQFLFRANCAVMSLENMNAWHKECIREYKSFEPNIRQPAPVLTFQSPAVLALVGEFTTFLNSLRMLQDLTIPLAAKAVKNGHNIPLSMADAVRHLGRLRLGHAVEDIVREYWYEFGKPLKHYRDLDQHHFAMTQHVVLYTKAPESVAVFLPDDPLVRGRKMATFHQKRPAQQFFENAFRQYHTFFQALAQAMGAPEASIASFSPVLSLTIEQGLEQTCAIIIETPHSKHCMAFGQDDKRAILQLVPRA